ncbi:MAG TPA: wax ester/triacylglycerol synthase domain-containing protein, partial [Anaeromyxobacteraceae bacterium]
MPTLPAARRPGLGPLARSLGGRPHVRARPAPRPGRAGRRTGRARAARVGALASARLDPAHPLWRVEAVRGRGQAALLMKLHHCIADGFALVSLLLTLADDPPEPRAGAHAVPAYQRVAPWLEPGRALLPALRRPGGPASLALQAVATAAALARMTALAPDPLSAWQRPLSGTRRVA